MKCVFEHSYLQIKHIIMRYFHPLDVVGRGSDYQLHVGEKFIKIP